MSNKERRTKIEEMTSDERQAKLAYYRSKRQADVKDIMQGLRKPEPEPSSPKLKEETIQFVPIRKAETLSIQKAVDGEINIRAQAKVETYCQEVQVELIEERRETKEMSTEMDNTDFRFEEVAAQEIELKQAIDEKIQKMNAEEIKETLKSQEFALFMDKSSKLIEKALDHKSLDLYEDMIGQETESTLIDESSNEILQDLQTFADTTLTNNRLVTSITWSPNLPELFMASYDPSPEGNPSESQGLLLLWSLSLRSRPEFTCYSQSKITAATFNKYSNSTVIAGTYSGQIVMWDLRAKNLPVQKSGITSGGHAYPIYSLAVVGSQNSHNIVSMSNDGTLCLWNPASLAAPVKEISLNSKKEREVFNYDTIHPTCFAFSDREANNFYAGSENGSIYACQIHHNRENESPIGTFSEHLAPVTSLSYIPENSNLSPETSNLLLSSSYDWTVKLWSPRDCSKSLWSFESAEDSVLDVCWNPANPTLFSSVDTEGYIDLWDLSKELEAPLLRKRGDKRALNKVSWSQDGSKMVTGGSRGELKLYGLQEKVLKTSRESVDKFEATVHGLIRKEKGGV